MSDPSPDDSLNLDAAAPGRLLDTDISDLPTIDEVMTRTLRNRSKLTRKDRLAIKRVSLRGVASPELEARLEANRDEEATSPEGFARYCYARLRAFNEANTTNVREQKPAELNNRYLSQTVLRILQRLSDPVFEHRLINLTLTEPAPPDPIAIHATNTTVLTTLMGRLLGLRRRLIVYMGIAASHHDLGRILSEALPGDDQHSEHADSLEAHALLGMAACLKGRRTGNQHLLSMMVNFEHHMFSDGQPKMRSNQNREPHLLSEMISVASAFDSRQNGRSFRAPMSPALALSDLKAQAKRYKPAIVDLLSDVLGRWPRGSLLRLFDEREALVLNSGARRDHRPLVTVIRDSDGRALRPSRLLAIEHEDDIIEALPPPTDLDWRSVVMNAPSD